MKKFFLTVCCLMVASVAMAQSDTVANVKNVYVTQDADRGRILLTVGTAGTIRLLWITSVYSILP